MTKEEKIIQFKLTLNYLIRGFIELTEIDLVELIDELQEFVTDYKDRINKKLKE